MELLGLPQFPPPRQAQIPIPTNSTTKASPSPKEHYADDDRRGAVIVCPTSGNSSDWHDLQGIDWASPDFIPTQPERRLFQRHRLDQRTRRIFGALEQPKKYKQISAMVSGLLRAKSYTCKKDIRIFHMQLHNNLRAISPHDFIMPSSEGLLHLNTQSMHSNVILKGMGCLCLDRYERYAMVGFDNNEMSLLDIETMKELEKMKMGSNEMNLINSIKFLHANDGIGVLKLVVAGNCFEIEIMEIHHTASLVQAFRADAYVNDTAVSKDGKLLAAGYDDTHISLFDMRTSKKVGDLKGHEDFTFSVDFSHSNLYLASGNQDGTCRIWDLRKLDLLHTLPGVSQAIGLVKFVQRDKYLIVGENESYIRCYASSYDYAVHSQVDFFGPMVGFDTVLNDKQLCVAVGTSFGDVPSGILRCDIGLDNNLKAL